ncbi:hypothetical protein ACEE21_15255 [Clostridium baratii]
MGSIKNLRGGDVNVHLLLTGSNLSELYVYDILKEKCNATRDSIYDITNKSSANEMLELVNTQPFMANKWLFVIEYGKVKSVLREKKGVFETDTSEFLIKVKNYKEYKEAKGLLSRVNDIYLSYIRYYDVEFLLQGYGLSPKLIDFVAKSYSSDPEQVFVLMNELKNGKVFEKRKDIVDICGISAGSLNSFALSLLKEPPKTVKGKKTTYRNRIGVALELSETYGFSKMRNFLMSCVKDILDIKQLYMVGTIYDRISDLPECYDEKKLSRYNMYLRTIIDIPYSRIMRLYLSLKKCGRWFNGMDMVNFIYQYYEEGDY